MDYYISVKSFLRVSLYSIVKIVNVDSKRGLVNLSFFYAKLLLCQLTKWHTLVDKFAPMPYNRVIRDSG